MPLLTVPLLISQLGLVRHPEGGWFREIYRADEDICAAALPQRYGGDRSICTSIYFLLEQGDFSALHRIKSDELWHFYYGSPLTIHVILPDGSYQALHLGPDLEAGEQFQGMVPGGSWFGAELKGEGFGLVGCTVAPGFDFADFELADRDALMELYPEYAGLLSRMTHER